MNVSLKDAIVQYWISNPKQKSAITTSLFTYCLPKLGFKRSNQFTKKLQQKDKKLALEFSQTIELTADLENKLFQCQKEMFKNSKLSSDSQRQHRKNLRHFFKFLRENHIIENPKKIQTDYKNQKVSHLKKKNEDIDNNHIRVTTNIKREKKLKISLSLNVDDYPGDSKLIEQKLINIKLEIEALKLFLAKYSAKNSKRSKYTNEIRLDNTLRLLGWLYKRKKVNLEDLTLRQLVDVFNINPDPNDFENINDFYLSESKIKHQAKKACSRTIKLLEEFFFDYKVNACGTKFNYVMTVMDIAKFLYQDITDINWAKNFEDIPIIIRLRIYVNNLPKDNKIIEPDLISWEKVLKCLMIYKQQADHKTSIYKRNKRTNKQAYFEKYHRRPSSIAKSLQKFIVFGLLTLVPPSRTRVIRELKLGKTFKHGIFLGNRFISKDNLDNSDSAKYYIHLQPENYKTGKIYGEWLAEFPNIKFNDGKSFYEYLDQWIYGGARDLLLYQKDIKQDHGFLLLQETTGKPLGRSSLHSMVKYFFKSTIGIEINPHKLRTIFRTYLTNKGASEAELKSAAFWMRHSNEIAKQTYTKQTLDEKLNPGIAIANRLNSEILNSIT